MDALGSMLEHGGKYINCVGWVRAYIVYEGVLQEKGKRSYVKMQTNVSKLHTEDIIWY